MDWMDHGKSVVTFVLSSKNCYDLSKKKNCYGDIVGAYEVVAFADTSLALFFCKTRKHEPTIGKLVPIKY